MGFNRVLRTALVLVTLAGIALDAEAATLPPAATSGVAWLQSQLQANGSLSNEGLSIATPLQARSETAIALGLAGTPPAALLTAVSSDTGTDTESLARHIDALVQAGQDPTTQVQALFANQNPDGGFGTVPGDTSDPLDTAWALLALRQTNNTNASALSNGLLYLVGAVDADGGYGVPASGSGSEVYVTAYVLLTYQAYASSYPLTPQISGGRSWLIGQQASGTYGDTLSDAIAVIALAASSTDTSAYSAAATTLTTAQQSDGSWSEDPYLTALAIRALAGTGSQPAAPTLGRISGIVLDSGTHLPIAGAQVSLSGQSSTTITTAADGSFTANNLAPGTYAASASANGYGSFTVQSVVVTAGAVTNMGTLLLSANPTTANIAGKVTDGSTGLPLAGVQIAMSGAATATTTSASDGSYSLTGLPPGAVTLNASLGGYTPVNASVTLTAGESLTFSPALYPTTSTNPPTNATLTGTVLDAVSKAPLAGATITVGSASVQADGSGDFALANLAAGPFVANIAAVGYTPVTLSGTLVNGTDSAGSVYLSAIPPSSNVSSVSGVITDAATNNPIVGATVQVQGTSLSTITGTDGSYQIGNIPGYQFSLYVSAPGYISRTGNISLSAPGAAVASVALTAATPPSGGGLIVNSVTADQQSYNPYSNVTISARLSNSSGSDIGAILKADLLDATGNVVYEADAIHIGLSQVPSDALETVPAGGSLSQSIQFNLRAIAAGTYQVVFDATDVSGNVLAQSGTAITVNALQQIGGDIQLSPPVAQAGAKQPIDITTTLLNQGNLSLGAGQLQLTVTLADTGTGAEPPVYPEIATYSTSPLYSRPQGGTFDPNGNLVVVDFSTASVLAVAPNGTATVAHQLPYFSNLSYGVYLQPIDVAMDSAGTPWVLNTSAYVLKVGQGSSFTQIPTGLSSQNNIALDSAGDIYLTGMQGGNHVLAEISASGQNSILVSNGLSTPVSLVPDNSGDLYVSNYGDGTVSKIGASGGITTFATGLSNPQGITMDAAGNLYVANSGANDVVEISPSGSASVFATGLSNPVDLQFGPGGNLYAADSGDSTVEQITPGGQVSQFAASAANNVQGMRYDSQGDLYMVNGDDGTLREINASGRVSILANSLNVPRGVDVDAAGNVYICNLGASQNAGSISKYSGGSMSVYATGFNGAFGVAFDPSANAYVTEFYGNRITEISAAGSRSDLLDSPVDNPYQVSVASDGALLVLNGSYISHLPLSGGGSIVATGVDTGGFTQMQDGSLYVVEPYEILKINPSTGVPVNFASIPYTYGGLATDGVANFYTTDYNNHQIVVVAQNGTYSTYSTLPGAPIGLVRDASGNLYTVVNNTSVYKISTAGAATLFGTVRSDTHQLAVDASGDVLVSNENGGTVTEITPSGAVTTLFSGLSEPTGLAVLANGNIAVAEFGAQRIRILTTAAALQQVIYGFQNPRDIVWVGDHMVFGDNLNRLYTLVPGQYPSYLATLPNGINFLDTVNGNVYAANGGGNWVIAGNGTVSSFVKPAGYPSFGSIALKSSGGFALGGGYQVVTFNSAQQVIEAYSGFGMLNALALDATGNVYVSDGQNSRIVKIGASGQSSQVYSNMPSRPFALRFDASGNFYANVGGSIDKVNANGSVTSITSPPPINSTIGGIAIVGSQIYVTDKTAQMVRLLNGTAMAPYAVGLSGPAGMRVAADGSIYVADQTSGSVMRYSSSGLSLVASGLTSPKNLAFDAQGDLFVGGSGGQVAEVSPAGVVKDLGVAYDISHADIAGVAVASDGSPLLTLDGANVIERVVLPQPQTPPSPGTVVYTTSIPAPALAVGAQAATLDFGSWTPQVGGDYTFTVTSQGGGVAGTLTDTLHVGPYAQGELTPDRTSVPPGNQTVNLTLAVQGADFTSVSQAHPANLALVVPTTNEPTAMGEDAAGDIYFLDNTATLRMRSPAGVSTQLVTGVATFKGLIPVDSAQNVYFVQSQTGGYAIKSISPTGQISTLATLPEQPISLGINPHDTIYAETNNVLYSIMQDGTVQKVYSGLNGPGAGTLDAAGDFYFTQLINVDENPNTTLLRIGPDGGVSDLANLDIEGEGVSLAGDCSDNLFVTPFAGSLGSLGNDEEHTIMELVGSTGLPEVVLNGLAITPQLPDMDFIVFDRFHSNLLMWTDDNGGPINQLPVSCGAIGLEAHVVTPAGQTLTGFNLAPSATLSHTDGSTEYVWDMQSVVASGQNIQFSTVLNGLQIGQTQPMAESAFLVFKNSFVTSNVTLPLQVPSAQVAAAVSMTAATDAPSYAANTPVNVTVGLNDSFSTAAAGNLDVQVLDASNALVADLGTQAVIVNPSSTQAAAAAWNTASYISGNYTVAATLTGGDGTVLARASAPFSIGTTSTSGGNSLMTVGVTTDKASYAPTETVNIDDRLVDVTSNSVDSNITLVTTVSGPGGNAIWTNTASVAQLVPGALKDLLSPLPLANAIPGAYSVTVTATLNGTALAPATASFSVQSSSVTASGIAGTLSVTPAQAPLTSVVSLTGTLANNGNAAISGATATLAVLDSVAGQLVFQSPVNVASLGVGQNLPLQALWTAAGTVNQSYVALLMVNVGGVSKTLAQDNFRLVDPTTNLTGALTAAPAQVQLTTNLSLTASVTNTGPTVTGAIATLSIQDPTGTTVFSSPVNFATLAQGQANQVLATWLAQGPVNETYTATLSVTIGAFSKTLASQAFVVIPPPIKIGAEMGEGVHGRVLILTDDPAAYPGNQDPFGPNPAPGLAAQNQHLGQVLTAAGWSYTIVTNADDFQTQFNTGGYETYVILSEAVKLPESLQEQVDAAVNAGQGLIVAGNHDDRNNKLEDALGIHSTGKCLSVTGLELDANSLDQAGGQVGFPIDGQPLGVNKDSATAVGNFELTGGGTAPAVFTNGYGSGKAVYAAFDLALEEAAANSPNSLFDQLMLDSLNYVSPSNLTPYTGGVIPIVLTLQNQGNATPGEAIVTLPTGVTVIDPNGATVSGNSLSWVFSLAVGQSLTETFWVQLPATAGSLTIPALVESGTAPNLTPQANTAYLISVQAKPQ